MRPLETLFLDAGGVLVHPSWPRVSAALARHGVAEPRAKRAIDTAERVKTLADDRRGWLYFNLVLSEAGIEQSAATDAALAELRAYHARHNLWEHVPDEVVPALERLRGAGLRLVVVSNANGTLRAHLARLGLDRLLDQAFDSHEEGVEKPDPRFFEIALERTGSRREATLHVGDLYHVDVVGARAAGLEAVLFDGAGLYPEADCARVACLFELADALARRRRSG